MKNLMELTGQESGIVIYFATGGQAEAVVCNWSCVDGWPRLDPAGLAVIGMGEEIPEIPGEPCENLPGYLAGVDVIYENGEELPYTGTMYKADGILIITPEGWN